METKYLCEVCFSITPTRKDMGRHLEKEHHITKHKKRYYDTIAGSSESKDTIDDFLKELKK